MKKLIVIAALTLASTATQAFDASAQVKANMIEAVTQSTKDWSLQEFCTTKGGLAYGAEGTPPDSMERAADYGMMEVYYMKARSWTEAEKDECVKLEMEAYREAADSVEGGE